MYPFTESNILLFAGLVGGILSFLFGALFTSSSGSGMKGQSPSKTSAKKSYLSPLGSLQQYPLSLYEAFLAKQFAIPQQPASDNLLSKPTSPSQINLGGVTLVPYQSSYLSGSLPSLFLIFFNSNWQPSHSCKFWTISTFFTTPAGIVSFIIF